MELKIKNTKGLVKEPIGIPNPEKTPEIEPLNNPIVPKIYPDELPKEVPEQQPNEKPPFEVPKPAEFERLESVNNLGFFM